MGSLAVLVGPVGDPQLTLQLLCDGVPLRALSLVDPATGLSNVRFVAPSPGGRITMKVHNGGMKRGALWRLERAELGPDDSWDHCRPGVVNKANVLLGGESVTVQRDESTGGRSILVETLRDEQGQSLSALDAEVRRLKRTKWRLCAWPALEGEPLDVSVWRLLDTKLGLYEVPLCVRTPTGHTILAASANVSMDWLQASVERELGIPRADQRLRTEDGSCPKQLSDVVGKRFQTLYVCGRQRVGPHIWFYVEHDHGKEFVVASSSDTVFSVQWNFGLTAACQTSTSPAWTRLSCESAGLCVSPSP